MEKQMNTKRLLVSFSAILSVLLLVMTAGVVSAATSQLVTSVELEVNGIDVNFLTEDISVIAGELIPVEVVFTALEDASDVRLEAELQGQKVDFEVEINVGDLEAGQRYREVFDLRVPYELQDKASDDLVLTMKLENSNFRTELSEVILRVQRPSYNTGIMSIESKSTVQAGESFSVDVVLKNIGYNRLDDLYIKVSIPALNIERVSYFGDLVAIETKDDDDDDKEGDTVRGRIILDVPYSAASGIYALEVEAANRDTTVNKVKQIFVENAVPESVIKSGNSLIVVNPTNSLRVYTIIADNSNVKVSDSVVVIPAGSSRTVGVTSDHASDFTVSVLSGDAVVGSVDFENAVVKGEGQAAGIVVLTVILAVIFVVLLVVLIVLLTKKPDREDELGESYY
ncbi:MAG: hypothetical protein WDZ77_02270 [Candidatus Pacearchaeota archaeon]